jgi:hypothetical protein
MLLVIASKTDTRDKDDGDLQRRNGGNEADGSDGLDVDSDVNVVVFGCANVEL